MASTKKVPAPKRIPAEDIISNCSKREYIIAYIHGGIGVTENVLLEDIVIDTEDEQKYSMQARFDEILDLRVGERLHMSFNRGDRDDSQGYIKRVK